MSVVALSVFSPYVAAGVRGDQIVTYLASVWFFPVMLVVVDRSRFHAAMAASWLLVIVTAGLSTLLVQRDATPLGSGSLLANLDNVALPLASFMVASTLAWGRDATRLVYRFAAVFAVGMAANAGVAVSQAMGLSIDGVLRRFWAPGAGATTAERALTLDRYTGIVGQPVLAGLLYAVALLCALFVYRDRTTTMVLVLAALMVGGALTGSRAFVFLGIPLLALQLMAAFNIGVRSVLAAAASGLIALLLLRRVVPQNWAAGRRLLNAVGGSGESRLSQFTGNRYGSNSGGVEVMRAVAEVNPVSGVGLSGIAQATDSAFVQSFVLAGGLGVVGLVLVLSLVASRSLGALSNKLPDSQRMLLWGLAVVGVAGSIATPAITGNRLAIVFWTLFGLLSTSLPHDRARPPGERASAPAR